MGVVYRVEHVHTGQEHALKVLNVPSGLSAELVERFKREARAPARIRSEHVVTVTDADVTEGGTPFLVMELLDGTDLEHVLEARERLTAREVVDAFAQVARVLDKAHALGIVHRDLKPENLFYHRREDGSTLLKVLDFGISKVLEGDDGPAAAVVLTRPGSLMGTPLYMSPEQAGAGTPVGPQSDVWALGIVAVRLLTGEYYWRAQSIGEMMAQLLRDPLYPPRERWPWLPLGFDAWFARSCDRDPQRRFAGMSEQVAELAAVLGEAVEPRSPGSTLAPLTATTAGTSDAGATVSELGATTPADLGDVGASAGPAARSGARTSRLVLIGALAASVAAGIAVALAASAPSSAPLDAHAAPSTSASQRVAEPVSAELPPGPSAPSPPRLDAAPAHPLAPPPPSRREAGAGAPSASASARAAASAAPHNPLAP